MLQVHVLIDNDFLGWAKKKGFFTAKAARLDTYRAANSILRLSLEGRLCLCFKPPGYHANRGLIYFNYEFLIKNEYFVICVLILIFLSDFWLSHSEVSEIAWVLAKKQEGSSGKDSGDESTNSLQKEGNTSNDNTATDSADSSENNFEPSVNNRFELLQEEKD